MLSTSTFHSGVPTAFSPLSFFLFFFRSQKIASPRAASSKVPSVAPTPMPALAPVVRPWSLKVISVAAAGSEGGAVLRLAEAGLLLVWKSASLNLVTNGSASSVPSLEKTVSAVAVTAVVFHVVHDGDSVAAVSLADMSDHIEV